MKLRIAIATVAVLLVSAGSARAGVGPDADVVVTGPSGVVWTGSCPSTVSEDSIDKLSETCRSLGYRLLGDAMHTMAALGGTKATWSRDGRVLVISEVVSGAYVRTFPDLGVTVSCPIVGDSVDMGACSRSHASAARHKARAKRHR